MKINVIFTGGTIGSKCTCGSIGLGKTPYTLLDGCENRYADISFEAFEPYSILSEELDFSRLLRLAKVVRESISGADAVIITHGTDTLSFAAAFLGYVLGDVKIPIVLVSSGYPLDDSRANGRENFSAAVNFARAGHNGVYAVWYANGEARIHRGVRLFVQRAYSDMLESAGGHYGRVTHGGFERNQYFCESAAAFKNPFACLLEKGVFDPSRFGKTLYLRCTPSMLYPSLEGAAAVIIESYHSGTLCADKAFAEFMASAKRLCVPVFIAGTGAREAQYETTDKYLSAGAIALSAASPAAMYVKLSLAISANLDPVEVMNICCGDFFD